MFRLICDDCLAEARRRDAASRDARKIEKVGPDGIEISLAALKEVAAKITLSTETWISDPEADRLGIVTGCCIFGQHVGRDIVAALVDFTGGRATGVEKIFADARAVALEDMQVSAAKLGAASVIAVQVSHQEMSSGGKSMVMVTAMGAAVRSSLGPMV
jgi:uncharacterized protein YbjQ (UPF0145 family)